MSLNVKLRLLNFILEKGAPQRVSNMRLTKTYKIQRLKGPEIFLSFHPFKRKRGTFLYSNSTGAIFSLSFQKKGLCLSTFQECYFHSDSHFPAATSTHEVNATLLIRAFLGVIFSDSHLDSAALHLRLPEALLRDDVSHSHNTHC